MDGLRNKVVTVETNRRVLDILEEEGRLHEGSINSTAVVIDSTVIPPCYIGREVKIVRSVVGPHVSLALIRQ